MKWSVLANGSADHEQSLKPADASLHSAQGEGERRSPWVRVALPLPGMTACERSETSARQPCLSSTSLVLRRVYNRGETAGRAQAWGDDEACKVGAGASRSH